MTAEEIEELFFRMMAEAYPHEMAEVDWPDFVAMVRDKCGWEMPEETIREVLAAT